MKQKKKTADAKKLVKEILADPMMQEYFEKQKKLFKVTLNKAIRNAQKKVNQI